MTEITDSAVGTKGAWVLYDGTCAFCVAVARRFGPMLRRRGFSLAPLQAEWVGSRLNVDACDLMSGVRVLEPDGSSRVGAAAVLRIAETFLWMRPFVPLARLPGVMRVLEAAYGWVARHRHCISGRCEIGRARGPDELQRRIRAAAVAARWALGMVWILEGALLKLIRGGADQVALVERSGLYWPTPEATLTVIGLGQTALGLWLVSGVAPRLAAGLATLGMLGVTATLAVLEPSAITHPYGGIIKNIALAACAAVVWWLADVAPWRDGVGPLDEPSVEPTAAGADDAGSVVSAAGRRDALMALLAIALVAMASVYSIHALHVPRWAAMWGLALAVYASLKWLTWRVAIRRDARPSRRASAAYGLAWPGMNAMSFMTSYDAARATPAAVRWALRRRDRVCNGRAIPSQVGAVGRIMIGAVLVWIAAGAVGGEGGADRRLLTSAHMQVHPHPKPLPGREREMGARRDSRTSGFGGMGARRDSRSSEADRRLLTSAHMQVHPHPDPLPGREREMGARGDSRSSGSNLRGWTLVRGWVVMIGLAMMLHFGLFRWLSAFWTRRGVDAPPLMDAPLRSASLSDFWGRRWNRAFRDLGHDLLFRPAAARYGASAAMLLTFLASGLIHELVISLPAGGGFGGPTAYFALQAAGIALERSPVGARLGMRGGIAGRGIALAIVMGPAVVLFHPPFVHRVITPFAQAIGAW